MFVIERCPLLGGNSQRCSVKKVFLKISQNPQENTCARVSFLIKLQASACLHQASGIRHVCNFIKKQILAQVFSCEFCEIFKNTIFYRTPPVAASELHYSFDWDYIWINWRPNFFLLLLLFWNKFETIRLYYKKDNQKFKHFRITKKCLNFGISLYDTQKPNLSSSSKFVI